MAQTNGYAPSPGLLRNPTSPRTAGRGKGASDSAIDCAIAQIAAAFGRAGEIKDFKLQVTRWLRLGPQHPAVRARFGARASALPQWQLAAAIQDVECWWREERKAFALASALGYGSRLSVETLRELRLILRLMRRKHLAAQFGALAAAVCEEAEAMAEAAE